MMVVHQRAQARADVGWRVVDQSEPFRLQSFAGEAVLPRMIRVHRSRPPCGNVGAASRRGRCDGKPPTAIAFIRDRAIVRHAPAADLPLRYKSPRRGADMM